MANSFPQVISVLGTVVITTWGCSSNDSGASNSSPQDVGGTSATGAEQGGQSGVGGTATSAATASNTGGAAVATGGAAAGSGGAAIVTGGTATLTAGGTPPTTGGIATTGAGTASVGTGGVTTATGGTTAGTGGTGVSAGGTTGTLGATVGAIELYGTFEAMGVIATLPAGTDPNNNAVANVEYRVSGAGDYSAGFPLTRTAPTQFVGSLFWLTPGTAYDVRVRYVDPDGAPLDSGWAGATASTRAEITIPSPARTLAVAPNGSGTACSATTPCALSQALSQAQAGDELLLAAGSYYAGGFTVSKSGTAAAPIVIRGQSGAILSFKFNSSDGDSGSIYLFHNTVDAQRASSDGLAIQSPSTWVRVMARNNIWAGTRYAIANNLDPLPPLDMDYDDLWGPNSNDLVYWQGLSNRHLAFGNVFSATGQESHALNVTPGFVAPDTADFTLSSSSQLVDRGCRIPGINDGFVGAGPDIGAVESH